MFPIFNKQTRSTHSLRCSRNIFYAAALVGFPVAGFQSLVSSRVVLVIRLPLPAIVGVIDKNCSPPIPYSVRAAALVLAAKSRATSSFTLATLLWCRILANLSDRGKAGLASPSKAELKTAFFICEGIQSRGKLICSAHSPHCSQAAGYHLYPSSSHLVRWSVHDDNKVGLILFFPFSPGGFK